MMNNTNITPPSVLKTLFPLEPNRHLISNLAAKPGTNLFVIGGNTVLFEGDVISTNEMKKLMVGGVTA